jgi:glyoxylase-like metal-dependent hydrolase (beta-lactamase superfamily II)
VLRPIDVVHAGHERVICSFAGEGVVVDPGPERSLETLLERLGGEAPRALLLTHVHLDHAGATGALVERFPGLDVYVHERGAPHLVDPARLLASAGRLYGDDMDRLWGRVLPVPAANLHVLTGGEQVLGFDVAATPGHASHHVAYRERTTGVVYTGDVAGVRIPPTSLAVAPTPPPDIDLPAWLESLARIGAWQPAALGLTHFGLVHDVDDHIAALRAELHRLDALTGALGREAFLADLEARIDAAGPDDETRSAFRHAAPPGQLWLGLERYWAKRASAASS